MTIRTISSKALALSNFIETNIDSVFVITANIDLEGSTLTMPANSKLIFKSGGRLFNGIFVGEKTTNDYLDIKWFSSPDTTNGGPNNASLQAACTWNDNILISETCILNEAFTINRSGIRIFGLNPNDAIIKSSSSLVINLIQVAVKQSYITIENIKFEGYQKPESGPDLRKTYASYLFRANGENSNITLRGCIFDSGTGGIYFLPDCSFIMIDGCVFRNMVFIPSVIAGGYGVVLQQSNDGVGANHVVISNCIFEKTVIRHAFYIQSSNDVLITNNIVYGTKEYNDALIDKLYLYALGIGPALTEAEIASIDIEKHMTKFDCAICYRGCSDIRIINNYFQDGAIVLNGTQAPAGPNQNTTIKGRFYLLKDNVIKNYCVPNHNNSLALYNCGNIDNYRIIGNEEIDITYSL